MPLAKVGDISIYYEIYGEGEPLLLIGGLATDVSEYTEHTTIVSDLAKRFGVTVFDNRGVGRTDKPDIPYSIAMMAADTAGLLKALHLEQVNVIGLSMGGRIALELTLQNPTIVKKLVLVSTSARVIKTWRRNILLSAVPRLPIFKGRYPQPYYAFVRQREASASYNCTGRLPELHLPVLIMHGKKDKMAPYELAEEMHRLITNSELMTFDGGHMFLFFKQGAFVAAVTDFLARK